MIIVRMRVLNYNPEVHKNGKWVKFPSSLVHPVVLPEFKFKNDYLFGFDIYDPKNWKEFLHNYRLEVSGQKLPRVSPQGREIRYDVYIWGRMKNKNGGYFKSCTSLFPGYDKEGKKLHPMKYGVID